ncbi:RNA-directed DNA polymerase, eukaryota [Tanacetum coccineum]|uniref:RNA-directed DNA polymerase, eukaryota n=1 Tax=Tanacetum coccineum TaxID=301880 RepID=A0ABQ5GHF5_9ASTR
MTVMVRLIVIHPPRNDMPDEQRGIKRQNSNSKVSEMWFILTGNLCFKGTKQVVHGDHRRGCSNSTLLRPHTNIEHIQLIDVEVQDAAAELDRLATISKDMELITRNRIRNALGGIVVGLSIDLSAEKSTKEPRCRSLISDRLVKNLGTIWIGSVSFVCKSGRRENHRNGSTGLSQSEKGRCDFLFSLLWGKHRWSNLEIVVISPALVLDEECVVERISLMCYGRVKSIDSITSYNPFSWTRKFVMFMSYLGGLKLIMDFVSDERQPSLRRVYGKFTDFCGTWNGEAILMGDYYEVRTMLKDEGSKNSLFSELRDMNKRMEDMGFRPERQSPMALEVTRTRNPILVKKTLKTLIRFGCVGLGVNKSPWARHGFTLNSYRRILERKKKKAMFFKVDVAKADDSASLLVNGSPSDEFHIHRGLKQGDPLSPFLFILVMEALHLSVCKAVDEDVFKGIQLQGSLALSHLFYADDAFFYGESLDNNLRGIINILKCFQSRVGLQINIHKSQILGVGVPRSRVEDMASFLGCTIMENKFRYLGVMVGAGMTRHKAWDDMILLWFFVLSKRFMGKIDSHSVRKVSHMEFAFEGKVQVLMSSDCDSVRIALRLDPEDCQSTSFWKGLYWDIPLRFCIVFAVGGRSISSFGVRSQNGTSGSLLFVFRVQLKVFWKESSTLLGGLFGDFGIVLLLMLISRLDRSFLRILSLPPFFGVIVGVVGSSLGMIGLKTRI